MMGRWKQGHGWRAVSVFLCVFGCQMLVSDQIQEIAAAAVSCHTVRDGEGERKRWKDVYTCYVCLKGTRAVVMEETQHVDTIYRHSHVNQTI